MMFFCEDDHECTGSIKLGNCWRS